MATIATTLIQVDGSTLGVDSLGSGEAVMLVHGLGFSRQRWHPHMEWLGARGYRVICPDLRGFGDSENTAPYTMTDLANDLDVVRHELGLESFHLVGHSMGGMAVQEYAVNHPNRLKSLTLLSTHSHSGRRAGLFAQAMAQLSASGYSAIANSPDLLKDVESSIGQILPLNDSIWRMLEKLTSTPDPARSRAWEAVATFSVKDELHQISCPTLIMHGASDMLMPMLMGQLIHKALPDSRWIVVQGGHNVVVKDAPIFLSALASHLDAVENVVE